MTIIALTADQTWPIRQQVMWPDKPLEYIKLTDDEIGHHYGLLVKNEIVSIVSLFSKNNEIQFRKFATVAQEQGKGYGSFLLSEVLKKNITTNTLSVWCNSRVEKSTFYEKFGLLPTNETFSKGGIDYIIMKKTFVRKNEN